MRALAHVIVVALVAIMALPFDRATPCPPELAGLLSDAIATQHWLRTDAEIPAALAVIALSLVAGHLPGPTRANATSDRTGTAGDSAGSGTVPGEVVDVEFTQTWIGTDAVFLVTVCHPTPYGTRTSVAEMAVPGAQAPLPGGSVLVTVVPQTQQVRLAPDPSGSCDPDGAVRYAAPVWQ